MDYYAKVAWHLLHESQLTKSLSIAQWLEHPTSILEDMGSIPVRDSYFVFVLHSQQN